MMLILVAIRIICEIMPCQKLSISNWRLWCQRKAGLAQEKYLSLMDLFVKLHKPSNTSGALPPAIAAKTGMVNSWLPMRSQVIIRPPIISAATKATGYFLKLLG